MLSLRVAAGDRGALLAQVLTIASLVALLVASFSFTNLLDTSLSGRIPAAFEPLIGGVSAELLDLVLLWSLPVWVALLVAAYFLSLHTLRVLAPTTTVVTDLGSYAFARRLCAIRMCVVTFLGWLLGWSGGVVVTQVAFRLAAFISAAPYFVPSVGLAGLGEVTVLTFSASALGSVYPIVRLKG